MSTRLTIVVGVTGGIAAYKAVEVVRGLVLASHSVHVVATEAALRFVGRPTFEAISRNPVETDLYEGVAQVRHVALGQSADVILIAPATANTIAKLAIGLADDLLTNTVLASTAPLLIAPAMHTEMWQNPATVANIATLVARGATIIGPAVGRLTGTDSGPGRLEESETILAAVLGAASAAPQNHAGPRDLSGRHVVVTAGGTREPLDPVRFLGNRSSGRQGVALAEAALARGARVTLIAAHIEVTPPAGATLVEVATALELQSAVTDAAASADIVVMAAAVADYRPATVRDAKIKKDESDGRLTLELIENPDILAGLSAAERRGRVIVGFAAETEPDATALLEIGRAKLARKGCDYLVLNRVGWSTGFASVANEVVMLNSSGDIVMESAGDKLSVANRIFDTIASR